MSNLNDTLAAQADRFAAQRSDHDLSIDQLTLLTDVLTELRHIRAALGAGGSISSVEIELDSKQAVKPHVKIYDLDPDVANAKAQEAFDELLAKYPAKP